MAQHTQHHAVTWFEIPVKDIDRAQSFYEKLLDAKLKRETMGPHTMVFFPCGDEAVGGCLQIGEGTSEPSTQGSLVFLNSNPSLDAVLARVKSAGGRITTPKVQLPGDMGVFAHITDTEGNRVGLHALA